VYIFLKKIKEAKSELDAAHSLNPDFYPPYYNMGVIYEKEFKYDEAVTQYRNCLNINPNFMEANVDLAAVLRILQKHQDAMSLLKNVTKMYPDCAEAWLNLSLIYKELGMDEEEQRARARAVSLYPSYKSETYDHGVTFGAKEFYDDGTQKPEPVENPKHHFQLSGVDEERLDNKPDTPSKEKKEKKKKAKENNSEKLEYKSIIEKAKELIKKRKYKRAIKILKYGTKLKLNKRQEALLFKILGYAYGKIGNYKRSIFYLKKSIKINPKSVSTLRLLGKIYGLAKKFEKQIDILKKIVLLDDSKSKLYYEIGLAYLQLKNSKMAVKMFKIFLEKNPDSLKTDFVRKLIKKHSK
jgi:tetratricopeptide (TPR) repeat protein